MPARVRNLDRLDRALSLLIDLTGTAKLQREWKLVDEENYASKNILAWHISSMKISRLALEWSPIYAW